MRNSQSTLDALRGILSELRKVVVAYSGGVDSAVVAKVASEACGDGMLACLADSPSLPRRELRAALRTAVQAGFAVRVVTTGELSDERYTVNPPNRCFFCKAELYRVLCRIAEKERYRAVVDGTNADDLVAHRPSLPAAREYAIRSPMVEAGLTKEEVRAVARRLGLSVAAKPSSACLSSRIPAGIAITPELLRQVEEAEDVLAALGFEQFRVRHHGDVARVELPAEDFDAAFRARGEIIAGIQAAGYRFVTLDLSGFKSGSLSPAVPLTIGGVGKAATAAGDLRNRLDAS